MKLYGAAFSGQGRNLLEKIAEIPLSADYGSLPMLFGGRKVTPKYQLSIREQEPLTDWTKKAFSEGAPLLFVGAVGIAVRAVSGYLRSKKTDSPVLVVDEGAGYVIPILSGHLGGANELARQLAAALHAVPVITTATDVHQVFPVDVFARKNNLEVMDTAGIAKVSSRLLSGQTVSLAIRGMDKDFPEEKNMPQSLKWIPWSQRTEETQIIISSEEGDLQSALLGLKTREYVLGIGCRKGKTVQEMRECIEKAEEDGLLKRQDIAAIASIDVKEQEQGLLDFAQYLRRPFYVFPAEKLRGVSGTFTGSAFVEKTVGVDNVCERAAIAASGGGKLVQRKTVYHGMTFAIAKFGDLCRENRRLQFDV